LKIHNVLRQTSPHLAAHDKASLTCVTMFHFYDDPRAHFVCEDEDDFVETFIRNDLAPSLGFTQEELSFMSMDAPSLDSWKDQTDTELLAGVDIARKKALDQASLEFDFVRKRVAESNIFTNPAHFSEDEILLRLFGPESEVFKTFLKHIPYLKGNYKLFSRCLGTFLWCCVVDQTLAELYAEDAGEFFNTDLLATQEEYKLFWQAVATACLPRARGDGTTNYHRGCVPFWWQLETAVNGMLQEL